MEALPGNPRLLVDHIRTKLAGQVDDRNFLTRGGKNERDAAVLFLLGMHRPIHGKPPEPCLIFTQRSRDVPQPGDLCFPGGGVSPYLDRILAGFLRLPGLPLFCGLSFAGLCPGRSAAPRGIAPLLATSLRESFEEMRLNPFGITYLGPMAPEVFTLFNRTIYPMVAWVRGQRRFVLNREVERIAHIPLGHFLDPAAYCLFRVSSSIPEQPCIVYQNGDTRDLLWGVTYRIVMRFLNIVFNFRPPDMPLLPAVSKQPGEKRP